jgi:hypothetical protein
MLRYEPVTVCEDAEGDIDAMPFLAGQDVALIRRTQTAGEIVREIVDEARSAAQRLNCLL